MLVVEIYVLRANEYFPLGRLVGGVIINPNPMGPGTLLTVDIVRSPLKAGPHGFHLHENPSLYPSMKNGKVVIGGGAGAHWDPHRTGTHRGPEGNGHLGDLPFLTFDRRGTCYEQVYAPRLQPHDFIHRSLIIHLGGDNYTDHPPNGGGKARVLGGVVR